MSPTPMNFMLVLLLHILLNVMDAKDAKTLLRMKNEKQEIVPHPVNGPGKILGHFMVAPNKIYREEKPGQEGYQYLTGWGHQGTPDPGCKGKAAGYIKNCQNKPIPHSQSCEEQLMAWQAECLMGKYISRRRRRLLDNFLRRNA